MVCCLKLIYLARSFISLLFPHFAWFYSLSCPSVTRLCYMKVKPGWFTQEMCFTAQTIHFKLLQFIWECVHSPVPVILLLFSDLPYLMDWLVCVGGGECPHVPLNAHPALGAAPWHVTDSRLFGTSFASMFRSGKRHLSPVWTSLQKVLGWLLMAAQLGSHDCFLQQCQTPYQKNNTLLFKNQTEFLCHFIPFFQFCLCSQLASVCWVLAVLAQGDKKLG